MYGGWWWKIKNEEENADHDLGGTQNLLLLLLLPGALNPYPPTSAVFSSSTLPLYHDALSVLVLVAIISSPGHVCIYSDTFIIRVRVWDVYAFSTRTLASVEDIRRVHFHSSTMAPEVCGVQQHISLHRFLPPLCSSHLHHGLLIFHSAPHQLSTSAVPSCIPTPAPVQLSDGVSPRKKL